MDQLALNTNPFDRHTLPGHVTASGIMVVKRKLLMIFHPFIKKWLQPGGHVEADETPVEAAHRELFEETGINGRLHEWHAKNLMPIDINVHVIPANPAKGDHTPQELANATNALTAAANKDPAFAGVFTLYNSGAPSLYVDVDREKAEKIGLTPTDVFSTLQLYLGSAYVNDFNYLSRTYQVVAQADEQFRKSPEDIARLKVRNASGQMVPIGSVASFKYQTTPYRQPRYNLYSAADVLGSAAPGVASGDAMKRMEAIAKEALPPGFAMEWTELSHQQEQHGIPTIAIFLASAVFVFLVLAAQYESWKLPLAIVLIVPMCLLASAIGLNFRGMPIDILAQIGFVVLVGLAAKNAILIVEFARQKEDHDGDIPEDAATSAAQTRLRPILMTSFAFILGVFPLVIATGAGAEMRQSLGTAVFSGMVGVLIFGLAFTPSFYSFIRNIGSKNNAKSKTAIHPSETSDQGVNHDAH